MATQPPPHLIYFGDAAAQLGVDQSAVDKLARRADEIRWVRERHGRRQLFLNRDSFYRWQDLRNRRTYELGPDDYRRCLEFALRRFYADSNTTNFRGVTRRDAGDYVTDTVEGKLGEIAFQRFLEHEFSLRIRLDFDPGAGGVIGHDINHVGFQRGGGNWTYHDPQLTVGIKATKFWNYWLLISENEAEEPARSSEAYVLCRVDLPPDHVFRFLRDHNGLSSMSSAIPEFNWPLQGEVAGFAWHDELTNDASPLGEKKTRVAGMSLARPNWAVKTGYLHRRDECWSEFAARLCPQSGAGTQGGGNGCPI